MPATFLRSLLPWPRTLKHKALWALLLVALLALGNVATMQLLLRRSDDAAATLNIASNMRMLGQRIALETLAAQQDPFNAGTPHMERYQAFEDAYAALAHGGSAYGQQVQALDARMRPALQTLYDDWQAYRLALDALRATPWNRAPDIVGLMQASDALLQSTEVLMQQLVQFTNQAHQRALWSSVALFVIDVLLLILGYLLLARQVLHPIQAMARQCRAISRGDYTQRSELPRSEELAELAQALNQSAQHIEQLLRDVVQERSAVEQIQAMFNGLADNAVAGIYMLDERIEFIYANAQLAQITGYPQHELQAHFPLARLFTPQAYAQVHERVRDRLEGRVHSARYERQLVRADGSTCDIEIFGTTMRYQGRPAVIGMMLDISERKRTEASMRRASLVYQHTREAMVVTDAHGVVLDINPAFTRVTGYEAHEILGQRLNRLSSGRHDRAFYQALWSSLQTHGSWSGDIYNRRKNGEEYIEQLTITTSYNEDGSVHIHIGLFTDVTQLRQQEASIWHQAHFDHLTELPNRQMFQQHLAHSIEQARLHGQSFALVFLDLDFFKEVNDTFGHDEGDELLRQVARRLRSCVRSSDLVARLGGDEFTLLLPGLQQSQDIDPLCRKLLHVVAQPYELTNNTARISVSAGVTFYPRDGYDGIELLKHADLAMYAAKDKGRNQYCVFEPAMEAAAQSRRLLLRDLEIGLDEQQFTLHYQPIVQMRTQRIVKAEALLRWQHPQRGLVGPGEFIELTEESGLIVPLGDWVLREAANQLTQWRSTLDADFRLSVNVSPIQLHSGSHQVAPWLEHLRSLQLPGEALTIEITERVLLEPDPLSDGKLNALQEAGMQLALDDFGTGYSSLSYLKRFDIDYIKIDRSFVSHLSRDSQDLVLCQAIIAMAHQLGIHVVAEGVETQEQHDILLAAGCDYGQGYWYCRPIAAAALSERLRQQQEGALALPTP